MNKSFANCVFATIVVRMIDTSKLRELVSHYRIVTTSGVMLWAPYLRNDTYTQDPHVPRGMGKSTPVEIRQAADYITRLFPHIDAEGIRRKLIDGSLPDSKHNYKGVDCSGFIYHVYEAFCSQTFGKSFMSFLSVPRTIVLNGAYNLEEWQTAHKLSEKEAADLPEDVPMDWVVKTFNRKPANLCNVRSLISNYSSKEVQPSDARPGDILAMQIPDDPIIHAGIILRAANGVIEVAHSGRRDPSETGGVLIEKLTYNDKGVDTLRMQVPREFKGIRRLKLGRP